MELRLSSGLPIPRVNTEYYGESAICSAGRRLAANTYEKPDDQVSPVTHMCENRSFRRPPPV